MKILLDENLGLAVARFLRSRGHDVMTAAEAGVLGYSDPQVAAWAHQHGRIVVTRDRDFGELTVRFAISLPGVVWVRLDTRFRELFMQRFQSAWSEWEDRMPGQITVFERTVVRQRPIAPS